MSDAGATFTDLTDMAELKAALAADPKPGALFLTRLAVSYQILDEADLRAAVATVHQEPMLFSGPIGENIAYGLEDGEAAPESIERAAKDARIAEFIEDLADGYDTEVGERGVRLSGGQRQRIALATSTKATPPSTLIAVAGAGNQSCLSCPGEDGKGTASCHAWGCDSLDPDSVHDRNDLFFINGSLASPFYLSTYPATAAVPTGKGLMAPGQCLVPASPGGATSCCMSRYFTC